MNADHKEFQKATTRPEVIIRDLGSEFDRMACTAYEMRNGTENLANKLAFNIREGRGPAADWTNVDPMQLDVMLENFILGAKDQHIVYSSEKDLSFLGIGPRVSRGR